jgi:NhaC family Na+:H+ antiporter
VLIVLIGAMTASWFASGTIQALIRYGLSVVSPGQVVVAGFVLASLVALVLGSSVGTVTTVGTAVMGVARAFGLPPGPVAGAVVSGAVFGDRVSLLSPIFHLAVDTTGSRQDKALRRIAATGLIAWVASLAGYLVVSGLTRHAPGLQGLAWRQEYLTTLQSVARVGPVAVIPPVLVILLATGKTPVRTCLFAGLVAAAAIALLYQGVTFADLARYLALGFRRADYPAILSGTLQNGGLWGTKDIVLLLLFSGAYSGLMEGSGMMEDISGGLIRRLRDGRSFLLGAMALGCGTTALASNQALSVIIPARLLSGRRLELKVPPESLAGALADSGVAVAALIPWNLMSVICSQALQCPTTVYAAYTFLAIAQPVVGAVWIAVKEKTSGAETSVLGS